MNTLSIAIENFVISGIHGLTHKEKQKSQPFRVDIRLTPFHSQAVISGEVADMVDYRIARRIAEEVIVTEQYDLLETSSERIANLILEQLDVAAVELTIRKPDIWGGNGIPVVTLRKERLPTRLNLLDFDVQGLLSGLVYSGGYAMPILPEARRLALLAEAETYQYVRQPEEVSSGKVREQVSSVEELPRTSLFQRLKEDFSDLIRFKLGVELVRYFPIYPFNFTELSLQLYETGSIGITPHLDGLSMLNLICIFTLTGQAKFALCDDRAGTNPHYLDTTPGNVTLLRSPGFEGSNFQPFHFVSDVTERRIVFGLRQKHQTSIKK